MAVHRRGARAAGVTAHRTFFCLALAQGMASLLVWTLAPPEAAPWHVHELVFGFALAAVGGFLLTRLPAGWLAAVAALWLAARLAYLLPGAPLPLRALLSVAASVAIALPAAQGFLRGAKQAANFVFPALMLGFPLADALHQAGEFGVLRPAGAGAWLGLGLVVLLIAAMGGRLVGAAASGAAQRAGGPRIAPLPRLESAALALLAAGFALLAFAGPGLPAAAALGAGGALLGTRLLHWLPGLRRGGGDLLALATGQAWLALGLLGHAAAMAGLLGAIPAGAALHLATVGGIGGTVMVMAMRVSAQREGRAMPGGAALLVAGLTGGAALLRGGAPPAAYPLAAAAWALAALVALRGLLGARR